MKLLSAIAAVLLCLTPLAVAQGTDDITALKALEAKWNEVSLKGDGAGLATILADKYVGTNTMGVVGTKADSVNNLKSGALKVQSAATSDLKIVLHGNVAVVTGRWKGKGVEKGKAFDNTEAFTDVFLKTNGKWQCISSHSAIVP